MPVITLTTDWNKEDYYLGATRGKALTLDPSVQVVDITHKVTPFNHAQAAFILRNSYPDFPQGSVHLLAVNTDGKANQAHLLVEAAGHYFMGPDNGAFGLLLGEIPARYFRFTSTSPGTFACRDLYIPLAIRVLHGEALTKLGDEVTEVTKQVPLRPAIDESVITGNVIYIDSYQNVITNITRELFERVGKGRSFDLYVQSLRYKVNKICLGYDDVPVAELLALFNSAGLLEIAIRSGNAADLLNLSMNAAVRVKFSPASINL
jgi:S-adenosyl-L-methionine hydrolase (adenosine-forming)